MTPNQVVASNVVKARALRGWTQGQAAEALAPYLGAKLSGPSFSALERSATKVDRIKQFSADDLLALSRGFDLPIGYFFTPPPETNAAQTGHLGGTKALDAMVLFDAILGTPDNLGCWMDDLLAYSADRPGAEVPDRLTALVDLRARARLRHGLGDVGAARDVLERLAEALRASSPTGDGMIPCSPSP